MKYFIENTETNFKDLFLDKESHFKLNEFVIPFVKDIKIILPELFLVASILTLILYSINLSTNPKQNYPLINSSVCGLSTLILILTFIIAHNNIITIGSAFNNIFVHDNLATTTKLILLLSTASYLLISQNYLQNARINAFEYHILILLALLGLFLLVSSYDLILAYLAIEMQSLSFYILAAFKKNSAFSTEAGLKYFILGAFSSSLILFGSSLVYGFTGTTNFGDLSSILIGVGNNLNSPIGIDALRVAIVFLGVGLLFKLSAAPFHVWSPDVYEGSPTSSTALFAIIPKIAIFVLFTRLFQFSFYDLIESWQQIIVFSAVLSVTIGSLVGLKQRKIKRLIAFSAISHVGYLLIAFATGTLEGSQALFFYLFIYIIMGLGTWALVISLELQEKKKKFNKNLSDLSVLVGSNSILAATFVIIIFSMGGVPPLAGFYAKMQIFFTSVNSSMYALATFGILSSVISIFYYLRIIKTIYYEEIITWSFYKPIGQVKSLILGISLFSIVLLFLNPNLLNLVAYKMVISSFI